MVGHRLKLAAALVAAVLAPACADDEPSVQTTDAIQDAGDGTTDVPTADTGHEDTGATPDVPDAMADTAADTSADATTDTGSGGDAGTDTGEPFVPTGAFKDLKALPVDAFHDIPGLTGRVDVTIDEWGIPHIFAESVEDAMRVDGWLVARDRFPQMEMIRRSTGGTLSKLGGLLDDGIIEDDIFARVMGFRRLAEQDWANLADGSLEKRVLDAYAAGVNAYLDRLRAGDAQVPPELAVLINVSALEDWSPVDSLVLARYQIWRLSFDAESEVGYTKRRVGADAVFRADSDDPKLAVRAGILADLGGWAPADPAIQYPGFPPPDLSPNPVPPSAAPAAPSAASWTAPAPAVLDQAQDFLRGFKSPWSPLSGAAKGASNSWIVSASKSATGNALLANDPHLDNDSPALFYQAHIVVEPRDEASGPPLDFVGAGFPGLPGVLIGHNQDVAWGLTTASYDYTDAFVEQLVWGEGDLPKVMRNGAEVDLEVFEETIEIGVAGNVTETITVKVPWVPGRGPLSPVIKGKTLTIPKEATAISYGWRGFQPSPEIKFLVRLLSAKDLADVQEALESWVLGSQNLVFAFRDGTIFSSGQSYIPERPAAAKTWDPDTNPDGWAPWWTLDGTGQHDWVGAIDRSRVPHAVDPPAGYVVAANNDQVGVTLDGDPLNDYDYIGYDYDVGFRAGRIERMLKERLDQGPLTLQDMSDIQLDVRSNQGERLTPFLLAAADALLAEYDAPGTHSDLTALTEAQPGAKERVAALRSLLAGWDFTAEDGVWGTPTEAQKLAAAQTSLFNAWTVAVLARAFNDERNAAPGFGFREQQAVAAAIRLLESPGDARTLDPETGESALWDDLTTEETETSTAILAAALFEADAKLTELFGGADTTTWLWGKLHTKSFESIIPSLAGGVSPFDWPQPGQGWDSGYPRRGDSFNVNVCHGGYGDYDFKCGSGPIMRFIAEMTPEGPVSWNTIPGGQVWDTKSKHFTDLLQLWLDSERHPFLTRPADVATSVETHLAFTP